MATAPELDLHGRRNALLIVCAWGMLAAGAGQIVVASDGVLRSIGVLQVVLAAVQLVLQRRMRLTLEGRDLVVRRGFWARRIPVDELAAVDVVRRGRPPRFGYLLAQRRADGRTVTLPALCDADRTAMDGLARDIAAAARAAHAAA
jgi:hypothetical protein